ncbi:MAG: hypothetical protein J7L14_03350 [Candidatus Diapherotrites archaeon]|nr:hypothetical protein [Candidatus Diapherotrites archaeon]
MRPIKRILHSIQSYKVRKQIVRDIRSALAHSPQLSAFRPALVECVFLENPDLCSRIVEHPKRKQIIAEIVTQLTMLPSGTPRSKYVELIEKIIESFS